MARQKKYTAAQLEKAIQRYFSSITRRKILTEPELTGELDKYGHPIYRMVPVTNALGETAAVTEYIHPPTVGGLCAFLKIHHSTWASYCDPEQHPEMSDCTQAARQRIQDYLSEQLLLRKGKDTRGVEFALAMEERRKAAKEAASVEADKGVQIIDDL